MSLDNLIFLIVIAIMLLGIYKEFGFLLSREKLQISTSQEELFELANSMYQKLNGKNFILSAGELNYEAYLKFKQHIESLLEKDSNTIFTIYCGPAISISDEYKEYIDEDGKLIDNYKDEWSKIHPILDLKQRFPNQLKLKLKIDNSLSEHFFYSEDDKVAWREEVHKPFEETTSYFRTDVKKDTIKKLQSIEKRFIESSINISSENAAEKLVFNTKDMFKERFVA